MGKDSLGSGSLVTSAGDILTNWHVIKGATDVGVVFKPIREGTTPTRDDIKMGRVIRYDSVSDLALVRATEVPTDRPPIRIGDSSEITIGADVHAIGHPKGQNWTYTNGIISQYRVGFEWETEGLKHKADVIQTKTPINPGNSGGPLIGDTGSLIGVNSFKTSASEGLNFAVSVDEVKRFLSRSLSSSASAIIPPATNKPCEPREVSRGRNKENTADVFYYDTTCAGRADAEYIIPDNKLDGIILAKDRNGDGRQDVMYFDFKRAGKWDLSYWDQDFKGYWTLVGYHPDGKIVPSRFESYDSYRKRLASR